MLRSLQRSLLLIAVTATLAAFARPVQAQIDLDSTAPESPEPRHAQIHVVANAMSDSVVLRWGVTTSGAWTIANKFGYRVERVKLGSNGEFNRMTYQNLTPSPLKPWPLEQWKARFSTLPDSEQTYPAIAAQMIHGKSVAPSPKVSKDVSGLILAAQEEGNRFGFALFAADLNASAAEASGLRYADHDVKLGDNYVYRVIVAGGDPTYTIDTGYVVVTVTKHEVPPAPSQVMADTGDGNIKVHWHHSELGGFSAYHVYRSEDNGRTYQRLTRSPVIALRTANTKGELKPQFTDTTVVNYRKYRYQVRGITPFAEVSLPAEVDAYAMDLTPPAQPVPNDPVQTGPHTLHITWTPGKASGDLQGFLIARSSNSLSGFKYIIDKPLPATTLMYDDNAASEGEPYYVVVALDTAGNMARSIVVSGEIIDTMPPSMPSGLVGSMDTNGVVSLKWKLGPERNLRGYRVLWANDPTHEFTQRTGDVWTDTTYTDTVEVRSLTPYVYYRVVAVNLRKNHSEMSAICAVKRPDLVPPEASIFTDVLATDSSAELHWAHSRSEDVVRQVLYRRTAAGDNSTVDPWQEIARLAPKVESYRDTKVRQLTMYHYQLLVEDSAGNRSRPSPPVQARPYDPGVRPEVTNLRVIYNEKDRSATLSWSYAKRSEDYWFTIYRSKDNLPIAQYKAIPNTELTFTDNALTSGSYQYTVRVQTKTGAQSRLPDAVRVEVR